MDLYNNESAEKRLRQSSTYMHWAFVDVLTNLSDVFSASFLSELPSMRLLPRRTDLHPRITSVCLWENADSKDSLLSAEKGCQKKKTAAIFSVPCTCQPHWTSECCAKNIWKSQRGSLPHFGPQYPESFTISKRGTTTFQNDLTLSWIFLQGTYKVRELEGRAAGGH